LSLLTASAQSEGGLLLGAEAEKKLSKKLSISLEAELRTRNNFKTMDRWAVGLGAQYKLTNWLKADAGYKLLNTNFREDINLKESGAYNHWRPSYWGVKHRFYASLAGSHKFSNNIKLELRERWQYTYRPENTVERWDFDNETWKDRVRADAGKNQLRSRFEVSYDRKRAFFTPFANVELYHSWGIEKIRYNIGTDLRLSKQHNLSIYYRYQDMKHVDTDDYVPDMHYLGGSYKFKF
jgi:long-subunit fatty acid transport protein